MIAVLAAIAAAAAHPAAAPDAFDRTFAAKGEPASLHAAIRYRGADGVHRLELWRDGDRRLAKVTDGRLATYGFHAAGGDEYRLVVLDRVRRIRTDIARSDLYRIGNFSDWFDLGHGLRHPRTAYRIVPAAAPAGAPRPAAACRWYAMTAQGRTTDICWSAAYRMPLLVRAGGTTAWRVDAIDTRPVPADRFRIADAGYARYDAGLDIERD